MLSSTTITGSNNTIGGENLTIEGANFRTVYKAAIGGESSTLYVAADEDVRANVYVGKNSAVDFKNFSGSAVIDLAKVGTDDVIFKSSDANETLTAGSGDTTIYGGGGGSHGGGGGGRA
ncbi:MAG: hypothetical protein IKD80_00925 [Selenomonadaceae bacterium]|nr:hypothetical protein [Selenomonadaceae bacterium]